MVTEFLSKSSDTSMGVKQNSSLMLAMYVCMYVCMCMIKIFIGGRGGGRGGGNSERCLKWGGESRRSLTLKT